MIGHPFDLNRATDFNSQPIWETMSSGGIWRGEFCSLDKNGNTVWSRASMIPIAGDDSATMRYLFVKDDITQKKLMEAQLRRSEQLYRTLTRNIPDVAILVFDQDLCFQVAEGTNLEQAGYIRDEVEGRTFYEVVPAAAREKLEPFYQAILKGEEQIMQYINTNGISYHLHGISFAADALSGGMIVVRTLSDSEPSEDYDGDAQRTERERPSQQHLQFSDHYIKKPQLLENVECGL